MNSINPNDLEEFSGNITGLAQSLKINGIQDIFKFVGDLPGMGEIVNNNQQPSIGFRIWCRLAKYCF